MVQRSRTKKAWLDSWKSEARFMFAALQGERDRALRAELRTAIEDITKVFEKIADKLEQEGAWSGDPVARIHCKSCGKEFEANPLSYFAKNRLCMDCYIELDRELAERNPCKGCREKSCFECPIYVHSAGLVIE